MVGFRNLIVHEYQKATPTIIAAVVDSGLDDLVALCDAIRDYT